VVVPVDASQMSRHLVLVRQMRRAGLRTVVALTMNDIARAQGHPVDPVRLSDYLSVAVVEVDGRSGRGVQELRAVVEQAVALPGGRVALPSEFSLEQVAEDFAWADRIETALAETVKRRPQAAAARDFDRWMLHPVAGTALFLLVMGGLFWSVFALASPMIDAVGSFFEFLGGAVAPFLPGNFLGAFVSQGVLPGIGAMFSFVPQIAILFLLMGILEDSGFLARGAMLTDRFLSVIGLNGRSFVPLLSANACAIPGILASRTVPGRKERLLTILAAPLMNCSARLPVYGLLLSFLVPGRPVLAGALLALLYLGGVVFASVAVVIGAKLLRVPASDTGFQLELPAWRIPAWRSVLSTAWNRTKSYLGRAGTVISVIAVLFWALNYPDPEHSLGRLIGHFLQPLMEPMGGDWRIALGLVAAFAAREVFVSTLAVTFAVSGSEDSVAQGLLAVMHGATNALTGAPLFTVASVVALLVYFMISMQCLATVAVIRKEAGSWRFALGQMVAYVAASWVLAVAIYQFLHALGL
jgi:ferrous iron transport protein B